MNCSTVFHSPFSIQHCTRSGQVSPELSAQDRHRSKGRLPKPARFRDTVRFTIDYRGRITHGRGLYFFKAEPGRPNRPQQIYSGGGTDGNPNWIPTYGPPNDKATWELIATVPAAYTVVSNGRLLRRLDRDRDLR